MFRNTGSDENGRLGECLSNWPFLFKLHYAASRAEWSWRFWQILVKFVKAQSAWLRYSLKLYVNNLGNFARLASFAWNLHKFTNCAKFVKIVNKISLNLPTSPLPAFLDISLNLCLSTFSRFRNKKMKKHNLIWKSFFFNKLILTSKPSVCHIPTYYISPSVALGHLYSLL